MNAIIQLRTISLYIERIRSIMNHDMVFNTGFFDVDVVEIYPYGLMG